MASKEDKKIIELALQRYQQAEEADAEFRREFVKDLEFISDDQWDSLSRQQRTESSRPCFTVDRINPSLRQIVNEERQNRPAILVRPAGSNATEEVAKVLAGIIRHIEQESSADAAYDTAGWYAAAGGVGYLRIRNEYEDEASFDQRLVIEAIADPMTVRYDPASVAVDGSDAEWAFIVDRITHSEYQRRYPEADDPDGEEWEDTLVEDPAWTNDNNLLIAEYFYRDLEAVKIYQVQDLVTGEVAVTRLAPPQEVIDAGLARIIQQRTTYLPTIRWCLMTSNRILERSTFAGDRIPIVPVYGESYFVNGQRFKCGAVRRAKDAQKILNYTTSNQVEIIDLNAKAPFIGAAGQFDTFEDNWRDANRKNFGYLEYNPTDVNGNPVPAPQRNSFEAPIQSVQATKLMAVEDIKAVFGIFDASLGAAGNETSGVAILARKEQSGVSNYHYYDNLVRSVRALGRILVRAIPEYYDTPRMVRIVKPNDEQEFVGINMVSDAGVIDLNLGRYDVVVKTGPSYSTRREEMVSKGLELISAYPNAAPLIADLVAEQLDFEGARQIARRLRAAVPPEIAAVDEEFSDNSAKAMVPQLQAQVRQAQSSLEALNAHAEEVERELAATKDELRLSRLRADVELTKAEMDQAIKMRGLEFDEQKTELDFLLKEQELLIQRDQLKLEEAKLALAGTVEMSAVGDRIFERAAQEEVRIATGGDAVDSATPSKIMESPSGLPG